jgi:hypothetical protein
VAVGNKHYHTVCPSDQYIRANRRNYYIASDGSLPAFSDEIDLSGQAPQEM